MVSLQSPSDLINREKVEDHELDPFSLNTEAGRWLKAEQEYYKSRGDITYSPVTVENDVGEKQLQDAFKECERRYLHEENFENSSPVLLISTNVSKDWIPPLLGFSSSCWLAAFPNPHAGTCSWSG